MKRKFSIIYNFTATATAEILAESEEEALQKAKDYDFDPCDYHFELDCIEVGKSEEVPDLDSLIRQAEHIILKADKKEVFFSLPVWPTIRCSLWNGYDYDTRREPADGIFWDTKSDEICFSLESGAEVNLSELPEVQQLEICQQIIQQAEPNGITL